MNVIGPRFVRRRGGSREIAELLQGLFASELLEPSDALYLISPWISNIPVLDNGAHSFMALNPSWTQSEVRLTDVIGRLMELGCTPVVATRPDDHNSHFLTAIEETSDRLGVEAVIHRVPQLHEKGILSDHFYLSGSMNLTFSGVSLNEEMITLYTDEPTIIHNRHILAERWWPTTLPG